MIRQIIVVATVLCLCGVASAAEPPKVVGSEPANGAKNVKLDIGAIRLNFDRNMKENTWTLWKSDKGELPPLEGENKEPWRDPKTFELKIQKLKPSTAYAIQLNSQDKQGFRSAEDDVALPVTVIAFRTAAAAPTSDRETKRTEPETTKSPTPPSKSLVGTWSFRTEQTEIRIELQPDGQYTRSVRSPQETGTISGTYRVLPGKMEFRPEGESEVVRVGLRLIDDNTVEVEDAGETYRFTRQVSDVGLAERVTRLPGRPGKNPTACKELTPAQARLSESSSGHILFVRYEAVRVQVAGAEQTLPVPKIFVMSGEGKGATPFITTNDSTQFLNPWWSPDGKRVLFASDFQSARSALFMDSFLADLESRTVNRITGSEWPEERTGGTGDIYGGVRGDFAERVSILQQACVSYQGGGGRIYRLVSEHVYSIENVPVGRIWVKCVISKHVGDIRLVDVVEGGHVRVEPMDLRAGNFLATNPSITPDGRYLVILLQHASYNPYAEIKEQGVDTIAVCDIEQGGQCVAVWDPALAYDQFAKDPRLSPDGKRIALSLGGTGMESLAVCSLQSLLRGAPQPTTVLPGEQVLASHTIGHRNPSWSPDGRRLAVVRALSTTQGFTGNLFVVNADGSGLRQITRVAANQCVANPSWSPDGERIAFQLITSRRQILDLTDLVMRNIISDIWTVASDGSDLTQLTRDGRSAEPAWGP